MAQDPHRIGRPPLAATVSQLPACRVPASLHDAVAREALRRDVSIARVMRDALVSHLQTRRVGPLHTT